MTRGARRDLDSGPGALVVADVPKHPSDTRSGRCPPRHRTVRRLAVRLSASSDHHPPGREPPPRTMRIGRRAPAAQPRTERGRRWTTAPRTSGRPDGGPGGRTGRPVPWPPAGGRAARARWCPRRRTRTRWRRSRHRRRRSGRAGGPSSPGAPGIGSSRRRSTGEPELTGLLAAVQHRDDVPVGEPRHHIGLSQGARHEGGAAVRGACSSFSASARGSRGCCAT